MSSPYQCPAVVKGIPIDSHYFREYFSASANPLKLLPTRHDLCFARLKKGFHGGAGGVFSVFPEQASGKKIKFDDLCFVGVAVHAPDADSHFGGILPTQLTSLATIENRGLHTFDIGSPVYARPPDDKDPHNSRHRYTAVLTNDPKGAHLIGRTISKGVPDTTFEVLLHGGA